MLVDREALEQLDRAALMTLVLTQQTRITALEAQVATLTARVNDLSGEPPVLPAAPPRPALRRACASGQGTPAHVAHGELRPSAGSPDAGR